MRFTKTGRKICLLLSFPLERILVKLTGPELHLLLNLEKQITARLKEMVTIWFLERNASTSLKEELSHACFLNPAKYLLSSVIDRLFS